MTSAIQLLSLFFSRAAAIRFLRLSALVIAVIGAVSCIRSPGSGGRHGPSAEAGASAASMSPEEAARIAAREQAAKEALDEIQIERDAARRKDMIDVFLKTWPESRHAAACIGAELATLAELDGNEAAAGRAALRESEHPDDPRILRIAAECLLDTMLRNEHALELARKALAMELAGEGPFRDAGEPDRTLRERETRYRLTLIRALAANLAWGEALTACDEALQRVPDNDAGLICALHRYRGDALTGAGRKDEAAAAYLQSVIPGDPRNRHTAESLAALLAPAGIMTPSAGAEPSSSGPSPVDMDRFRRMAQYQGPVFDDITEAVGLTEYAFGRVAWGDADSDGWPDILLDGSILLRNEAGASFHDITADAGLIPGGRGGLFADVDNDGDPDVFMLSHDKAAPPHETDADNPETDSGESGDRLYLNDGAGHFSEVPGGPLADDYPSEGAAWSDLDGDGMADLYVANYERDVTDTGGERGIGSPDRVYRNLGDGRFEDISAGFVPPDGKSLCGRGVSCADFNNDGRQDVFVSNYRLQRNFLWVNQSGDPDFRDSGAKDFSSPDDRFVIHHATGVKDFSPLPTICCPTPSLRYPLLPIILPSIHLFLHSSSFAPAPALFRDEALERGVAGTEVDGWWGHTIGSAWGDCDNDGDLDLFSANLAHPRYIEFSDISQLLINSGPPDYRFTDRIAGSGITYDETHSNPAWADVDNDGDLDLYITSIYENERSYLYLNDGTGLKFTEAGFLSGTRAYNGWGCAFADFDRDGDLDLLVGSGSGIRLFRNRGNSNHWLRVAVSGKTGVAAATTDGHRMTPIGARVTAIQGSGVQIREIQAGSGTTSQDDGIAHFGLGSDTSPLTVRVVLTTGETIERQNVAPDGLVEL